MTLSVSQLLELPVFSEARVCAGAKFLGRSVRSLNVLEILVKEDEDIQLPGHIILTTLSFAACDEERQKEVFGILARIGCVGVILQLGVIGPLKPSVLAAAEAAQLPIIELPSHQLYHTVISSVVGALLEDQSVTERYAARVRSRFSDSLADGTAIDGLLNSLADETGRAVALVSEWAGVLATSSRWSLSDRPNACLQALPDLPTSRGSRFEVIDRRVSEGAWLVADDVPGKPVLSRLQRIAVDECIPLAKIWLLAHRRSARERRNLVSDLVSSLVESRQDAQLSLQQTQALGYDVARSTCVVVAEPKRQGTDLAPHGRPEPEVLDIAATIATTYAPHAFVVSYAGSLVVVMPAPRGAEKTVRQFSLDLLARLGTMLAPVTWRGGIGSAVASFADIGKSLEFAQTALRIGASRLEGDAIISYDEVAADAVVFELGGRLEIRQWALSLIGPLKTEQERRSELIRTLNVLFESSHSHKVAAARLEIHPKSLKYRLDRIVALLGVDPFKPEHHFSYYLAARIALTAER